MEINEREQAIIEQLEGKSDGDKSGDNKTKKTENPFKFRGIIFLFIGLTISMLVCAWINGLYLSTSIFFKIIPYLMCLLTFNLVLMIVNNQASSRVYSPVMIVYTNFCIILSGILDYIWSFLAIFILMTHGWIEELMSSYMTLYIQYWGRWHVILFLVFLVIEYLRCKKRNI